MLFDRRSRERDNSSANDRDRNSENQNQKDNQNENQNDYNGKRRRCLMKNENKNKNGNENKNGNANGNININRIDKQNDNNCNSSFDFFDTNYVNVQKVIRYKNEQYRLKLLVDNTETTKSDKGYSIVDKIGYYGIIVQRTDLKLGDFVWILENVNKPNVCFVLNLIVERKRMDDLESSIKDQRAAQQKLRLKRCGITRCIYLVENSIHITNSFKTYKSIENSNSNSNSNSNDNSNNSNNNWKNANKNSWYARNNNNSTTIVKKIETLMSKMVCRDGFLIYKTPRGQDQSCQFLVELTRILHNLVSKNTEKEINFLPGNKYMDFQTLQSFKKNDRNTVRHTFGMFMCLSLSVFVLNNTNNI